MYYKTHFYFLLGGLSTLYVLLQYAAWNFRLKLDAVPSVLGESPVLHWEPDIHAPHRQL